MLHIIRNRHRLAKVRHLIRTGRDVNAYDSSGWTPLLRAAYHGDVEVARELIRANADIHLKVRESGKSALYTAAYYICQALVKFYLLVMFILRMGEQAAGEVVAWKIGRSGRTALHIAAYYGHQSLVKLFLETNININEQDDEGRTALMLAVERGHSAVVDELVKAGADISLKDKKGMTAVHLARNYDMVGQLVRDVGDLWREDCSRILWHACDFGDLSMVQSVIEAGCDVDHIHKGQTPVMMATLRGHDSIVKELILANCNVSSESKVLLRDMLRTLNVGRVNWAKASYWMAAVVCAILPCHWMKFQINMVAGLWNDLLWGSLYVIAMLVLAIVAFMIMPGSWIMMLVSEVIVVTIVMAMNMAMVAGPVPWVLSIMIVLAVPLVRRGPEVTVAAVVREVVGTVVNVAMSVCSVLALIILVPVILAWSPRDIVMTRSQVVAGVLTIMAVFGLTSMLWKRIVPIWQDLVMAVSKGVILTVEIFIVVSSCMMIVKKAIVLHESQKALGMMEFLMAVVLCTWFLLMVLKPQATEMALCRGIVGFTVFEATKLLNMEDALVSLDNLHLVLMVVVTVRLLAGMLSVATKRAVLLKGVVAVLHILVAVAEAYLAVIISKEGADLWTEMTNLGEFVNPTTGLVMVLSFQPTKDTALHYAASYNLNVKCGVFLVEAGADVRAKNRHRLNPLELGSKLFVDEVQRGLSFTTKRVIAVIGNTENGKSTLVAALECTSDILWKKTVNHYKKVHDIRQRTAGIEAVPLSNRKYGEALFYDFAGQSQYHGPHQSFLEAMVSKPGVSVTLLLLVKATEEEDIITQQFYHWLQPLALMSIPITPQVVVVGSFLDQVKSKKEASEKLLRCTQSMETELALDIQGPCLLDCRQPESKGINQICSFLQEARPVNTNALSYNLHWVLVQVRKAFSIPALRLHEFQTWLQDNAGDLPRNLPSPEEVCQDLSAAGHTLFLPNKQDPSQSWLILNLQSLLHDVYGTLFSGYQVKDNPFGLLHHNQLANLFPELVPEMIQEVLKSLEFCIKIDPLLLKEELLKLTTHTEEEGWLYFPALVSAQPCNVLPENPYSQHFQWMCWQLRTDSPEKQSISARLLQTIILRLAATFVFIQETSHSVRERRCSVWVNGISWSSTKGVDIAVQISDSSVMQVVGRVGSKAGPQRLQQYTAAVVQDVTKTIAQLSPKLEATPYVIYPYMSHLWKDPKAAQLNSLFRISTIKYCLSRGHDHTLSESPNTASIPIDWLFGGELPAVATVHVLSYPSVAQNGELTLL